MTPGMEDTASRRAHWEAVYAGRAVDEVSWWQPVPTLSLRLIEHAGLAVSDPVIDVGAGCSTLTGHLLRRGHRDVTVVDVSSTALTTLRERLGEDATAVRFEAADVLDLSLERRYALWHDRAVFHFLTLPADRDRYRDRVDRALRPGGWLVVATFAPDGPSTCSGLPVQRYSAADLASRFPGFDLVSRARDVHVTPWAAHQPFTAVLLRRRETHEPG